MDLTLIPITVDGKHAYEVFDDLAAIGLVIKDGARTWKACDDNGIEFDYTFKTRTHALEYLMDRHLGHIVA